MRQLILMGILSFLSGRAQAENVSLSDINVTEGRVTSAGNQLLRVDHKQMRAVLKRQTAPRATLAFVYHGPSPEVSHLDNGEVRHQLGLKLKAQNTCNLVYVMWDFDAQVVRVSVKTNPEQISYLQCADRGYTSSKPDVWSKPPTVNAGESHALQAEIVGNQLTAKADGIIVWQGALDAAAESMSGPVGLRSDNVSATFRMDLL